MRVGSTAIGGALLLAGCATDKVTLLENEAGHETGAVAVIGRNGGETLVDKVNSQAGLRGGPTSVKALKQINPAYTALLTLLPPPLRTFHINFGTGETKIPQAQRGVIDEIRAELSRPERKGAQIEVAGFTDSVGGDQRNDTVSKDRAEAVAQELRESGFSIDANDAVGRGEDDAKGKLGDEVNDETYRRVDVIIR